MLQNKVEITWKEAITTNARAWGCRVYNYRALAWLKLCHYIVIKIFRDFSLPYFFTNTILFS
jgi:hypothetical protein